jgi:hypothetical protein
MAMGASVLALSEAAQQARTDQAAANPNTYVHCAYTMNYDPKICNKTKQQAVDECKLYANLNQFDLIKSHDRYVKGSQSKYEVGFIPPDPVDCERAGKIKVVVEEKLRDGLNGTFAQNGKAFNFTAPGIDFHGHPHHMDVTLDAPYDCATLMPGSAVTSVIKSDFVATPGWSNPDNFVFTVQGPVQTIC